MKNEKGINTNVRS